MQRQRFCGVLVYLARIWVQIIAQTSIRATRYPKKSLLVSSGSRGGGGGTRPPRAGQKKKKKRKEEEEKEKKSVLGFVKSDHRSTMSEGQLNALLRLSVSTRTYTWVLKKW